MGILFTEHFWVGTLFRMCETYLDERHFVDRGHVMGLDMVLV